MARKRESKTNAMRMVDAASLPHVVHEYDPEQAVSGTEVADFLGQDYECVFKTLVTVGHSGEHYVFMIPVAEELDLKKAARSVGEKSVHMIKSRELLDLTGYVHGGCSPLGMKKVFVTRIDETAILFDTIVFSGGRRGAQVEMSFDDLARLIDVDPVDLVIS